MSTPVMIEARNLSKQFGHFLAVRDVSFEVPKGQVVAFLGPNGAGKTTTMRLLTGFIAPTKGHASIAGIDVQSDRIEAAEHLGYLPENGPLYPDQTPHSLLQFFGSARGMGRKLLARSDRVGGEPVLAVDRVRQADRQAVEGLPAAGVDGPGAAARPGRSDHGRAHQRAGPKPDSRRAETDPRAGTLQDDHGVDPHPCRRSSRWPTACCSSTTAGSCSTARPSSSPPTIVRWSSDSRS